MGKVPPPSPAGAWLYCVWEGRGRCHPNIPALQELRSESPPTLALVIGSDQTFQSLSGPVPVVPGVSWGLRQWCRQQWGVQGLSADEFRIQPTFSQELFVGPSLQTGGGPEGHPNMPV